MPDSNRVAAGVAPSVRDVVEPPSSNAKRRLFKRLTLEHQEFLRLAVSGLMPSERVSPEHNEDPNEEENGV